MIRSPFPGMDPYLEHPLRWPDVHQGLIGCLRAVLNTLLPSGYVANIRERCQIVPSGRSIYPDVLVKRNPLAPTRAFPERGGVATLVAPDPPLIIEELPLEPKEVFIDIRHVGDLNRVVTTIEVLSPINKTPGTERQRLYLQKQQEIVASWTHLLEIDLLRAGQHTVAVSRDSPLLQTPYHYLVCLHRGGEGRRFEVWPNSLSERLPRISIPLEAGVEDITLDLQVVFDRNYEEGAYGFQMDYEQEAIPPLTGEVATWADTLLREKHLR